MKEGFETRLTRLDYGAIGARQPVCFFFPSFKYTNIFEL